MFFTYASRILSILALARYARWASSSGEAINKGIYSIAFVLALGTLAEISFAVRKQYS